MVSGTMTGLAAARVSRWSMAVSRSWGSTDRAIDSAGSQPGRIGSGTSIRASSTAASTALVPTGRSTAAPIVRVATSSVIVSSGRPVTPSSSTAITSSGVVSIWTISPGRCAAVTVNGATGRFALLRRRTADPNVCRPPSRSLNTR